MEYEQVDACRGGSGTKEDPHTKTQLLHHPIALVQATVVLKKIGIG